MKSKEAVWEEPEMKTVPLILGALMLLFGAFIEVILSMFEESCDDQGIPLEAFRVLKVDGMIDLL